MVKNDLGEYKLESALPLKKIGALGITVTARLTDKILSLDKFFHEIHYIMVHNACQQFQSN